MLPRRMTLLLLLAAPAARAQDAIPRPEHPDPLAVREHWSNLNGKWDFRFDAGDEGQNAGWYRPGAEGFDRTIVVPFPWESALSGIQETSGRSRIGWYRRTFRVPDDFPKDQHVWLRFGAVDWRADVWVNGEKVGDHEGGYTPFEFDITEAVKRDADNTLVVRAFDPTDPSLPTGKQVGWYTTTSGIWQTVWLEARPTTYIAGFTIRTELDPARAVIVAGVLDRGVPPGTLSVRSDDPTVSGGNGRAPHTSYNSGIGASRISVSVDVRDPRPWTPESPHLYDITLELKDEDGKVVDSVKTYFGLREIKRGTYGDSPYEYVLLNGKPLYLRLALDQSFNPRGIYTAPSDEFLRKDIELARSVGLNGLRIHIKPEEPRRLYWADKLGLLIMQDMPNTWRQNARARDAWEKTMRETIARDKNHPSIFSWVAFNETWGLGRPDDYKRDTDTQAWVKRMVAEIRKLDPTRLVEDNSPCNYDHVEGTDLNSWHFYIDDADEARRHVAEVVEKSEPGSPFNYCPGERMNTAPLINSEYGAVSAGGGDRDISWGFRDLTTLLRKYPKIQGYVYTELTDIEWEHNGFADYDRSPKTYGYDAFVPGMTVADLQGADFVGYDAPPCIVANVGETIRVPLFVSHYSDRAEPPTLRWWVVGVDDEGKPDRMEPRERPVEWKPYDVVAQPRPLAFRLHGPFVGAVGFELVDKDNKRIAANFVNVVVKPESPSPRVERLDDHHVALRFDPTEFSRASWSGSSTTSEGKAAGVGEGAFTYSLKVPEAVAKARPSAVNLRLELGARGDRSQVDWPERVNPQDYPQTDSRPHPSSVRITLNDHEIASEALPDDLADARGVLSHLRGRDHGSHGTLIEAEHPLRDDAQAALRDGKPLSLRLQVPAPGGEPGGLAIYGASTGAYPFDPALILTTDEALPENLGVDPNATPAVDTFASRRVLVFPTGEFAGSRAPTWAYTTDDPGDGWPAVDFDDSGWRRGAAGFGTRGTPGVRIGTRWDTPRIWLRTTVELPALTSDDRLTLRLFHDEDATVFVNGQRLLAMPGYVTAYRDIDLTPEQSALFREGKNTLAIQCRQTGGGQGIDAGLVLTKGE
jgi:hypothetical protein